MRGKRAERRIATALGSLGQRFKVRSFLPLQLTVPLGARVAALSPRYPRLEKLDAGKCIPTQRLRFSLLTGHSGA
jgi:hypothetical protein